MAFPLQNDVSLLLFFCGFVWLFFICLEFFGLFVLNCFGLGFLLGWLFFFSLFVGFVFCFVGLGFFPVFLLL